jgi:putative ABC transport system permease protein
VGLALGSAATWAVARLVATRLYGVAPSDPSTIGAAAALLAVVATAAGYVPAWRATRVKPSLALRHE